jgi:hypothetical protein
VSSTRCWIEAVQPIAGGVWFTMLLIEEIGMRACSHERDCVPRNQIYEEPVRIDVAFAAILPLANELVISVSRLELLLIRKTAHHGVQSFDVFSSSIRPLPILLERRGEPRAEHRYRFVRARRVTRRRFFLTGASSLANKSSIDSAAVTPRPTLAS